MGRNRRRRMPHTHASNLRLAGPTQSSKPLHSLLLTQASNPELAGRPYTVCHSHNGSRLGQGLLRASGWPKIDLAVISYVFYHYMSRDLCYDWLAAALRSGEVG